MTGDILRQSAHHADGLRGLAGEYERERHDFLVLRRGNVDATRAEL